MSMRNLMLEIRFVGTAYHGSQVQKNGRTITQEVQDAMEKVLGRREDVKGCSRTDAGVHANRYVLNFRTQNPIPCHKLPLALNTHLPGDIAAVSCREVSPDFHARYSCTGKEYLYQILNAATRDPFLEGRAWRFAPPLDERRLHALAQAFVGRQDFAAMCASGSSVKDTVRTVQSVCVRRSGSLVLFFVRGDGFLYHMVRIMVGTLIAAHEGKLDDIGEVLRGRDRSRAGETAPACGLYLNRVFYPEQQDSADL